MTLEDIADFCEIKNCQVSLGDPELGFIRIDGGGVISRANNYRRFLAFNELASLPSAAKVLESATLFLVDDSLRIQKLSRQEFQDQLTALKRLLSL
jgi:hypothetical protein